MITSRWLGIGALVLACAVPAYSQEGQTITFRDAVRIALERNSVLRIARNSAALDATAVRQQRAQLLPDLRLNTQSAQSYGRSFSQSEGRVIDQSNQTFTAGVSSGVTLFNGLGNVAGIREAQLSLDASEWEFDRTRQTVVFTVAANFLGVVQQQEQLRVRRETLAAEEALERQIQEYVDAGLRPIADLYQQQASVASARFAVVEAQRAAELAKVDVIQTLQLDPRETYAFEVPELEQADPAGQPYDLDSLMSRALAQRIDLDASEARVRAAEQGLRAARAASWPTLSLNAGYNTAYTSAADLRFIDQLDQRRGGSIGLSVSLPIFDRAGVRTAAERARIVEDNARISLETQQHEVALQIRRAHLDFEAAREQLRAAEAQLRAAELALQSSQERYEVGAATLIEVTQARATGVQAASAMVSARHNLLFQRTLMDYYVGSLDPERVLQG